MSTATAPIQVTARPATGGLPLVEVSPARHRTDHPAAEVPAWAQLFAAIVATSLVWFAVTLLVDGWGWLAAIPATLAGVIFGGAVLPDVLAAVWERNDGIDA